MITESKPSFLKITVAGFFMGLANLIPGVSGGTMILALGLYDQFIGALSDLTRFKFSKRALILIGTLFSIAVFTILLMAGVIQFLMELYRPEMLGLFIGLTLGGAPMLLKEVRPLNLKNILAISSGLLVMVIVAFVLRPGSGQLSWLFLFVGGIVGSSAMILPGISGSYLLLVLGLYLPIISSINDAKNALKIQNFETLFSITIDVVIPFGLGMVVGLIALSNILKICMAKYPRVTHGFLLGFLLGSVLGLYPFQAPTFEKLVRHAVPTSATTSELYIIGRGWDHQASSAISDNLKNLGVGVKVLESGPSQLLVEDIDRARSAKAVVISYDLPVSEEVRSAASNKQQGKVPLIIVPNTDFGVGRAIIVFLLLIVGYITTFAFGRMKN